MCLEVNQGLFRYPNDVLLFGFLVTFDRLKADGGQLTREGFDLHHVGGCPEVQIGDMQQLHRHESACTV